MNKARISIYLEKLEKFRVELQIAKNKHAKISILRLVVFISILLAWFYVFPSINSVVGGILGSGLIVVFFILLKIHLKLEEKRKALEAIIKINQNEIDCCSGNFTVFNAGDEYIDHNHPYSYDIDLFGSGSLFQYLNRTVTIKGKNLLSGWLKSTPLSSELIVKNQQAIAALSNDLEFRQGFQTMGSLYASESEEEALVNKWITYPIFFKKRKFIGAFLYVMPVISLGVLTLVIAGKVSVIGILWVIVANLLIIGLKLKKFNNYYNLLNQSHLVLTKISKLVQLIETHDCKSDLLIDLKSKLKKNGVPASSQIQQLTKLLNGLDNRNNIILGVVLNGFLLWDWQYIFRIEKWQLNHKVDFSNWLECIATFDALNSLANLYFNNPDFTFPELSSKEFEFSAKSIGHPLLSNEVRVCNDFEIQQSPRYAIVTGANMAGKSTFLRTIATNIVLAGCGAPICAKKLIFTALPLHSSMRAEDSLMKNESYFFAELKRLQRITQELDKGEKLFIILDEILRGTNSEDKRKGSIGFVKKITQKLAHGLIATHDLELARLAEQQPEIFKALCFEVTIENNELKFDYKLQPGVTKNMNATYLMESMGIIDKPCKCSAVSPHMR